jgi:hypothetical protein
MEEIYLRDPDAFKGPKRRAREKAFPKFRAIITWWTTLLPSPRTRTEGRD